MIESIRLLKYKAFEEVEIPIKPLTIFLGANSVGKSSIIQMLMLMHQTAESKDNSYSSALKIYGNYVNAGACENLFKDKKMASPLVISVSLGSKELVQYFSQLWNDFIDVFVRISVFSGKTNFKNMNSLTEKLHNRQTFMRNVTKIVTLLNNEGTSTQNYFFRQFAELNWGLSANNISLLSKDSLVNTYDFLYKLTKISSNVKIQYKLKGGKTKLKITDFEICDESEVSILRITGQKISSNVALLSDKDISSFINCFKPDSTIFDCIDSFDVNKNKTILSYFMNKVILKVLNSFKNTCLDNSVNYVSPLRAHPKRYYMLDKANTTLSLNTLDGDEIAEVLKENPNIKNRVNSWFDMFGLKIDINNFKEIIHNLIVTQNNLKLDITDVGFGISQVLPIIIQGCLSPNGSITIIEQPEIHLHPRMQADLGDLFLDIVKNKRKKLIIETHSEYLLRRIRRRISEGKISANDVAICLFHSRTKDQEANVEILNITNKGSFTWPEEFYGGELYDDITEFLKNQS